MHRWTDDERRAVLGELVVAARVDGDPTSEQRRLLGALADHVFHVDVEGMPNTRGSLTEIADESVRRAAIEGLVVLELVRHPPSDVLTEHVSDTIAVLGGDPGYQQLARDYLETAVDLVANDWQRLQADPVETPPERTEELAPITAEFGHYRPGSLGRAFHDFYERHGFAYPPENGTLVRHDFCHAIAGYEPTPEGELALQAMLVAACQGERHFPGLLASLLLYEVGMMPLFDIVPTEQVLNRPGAAEVFADAIVRGAHSGVDFDMLDHLALADRDLVELRGELGITPPPPGPHTFGT